jgi:hypothetical protein
MDKDEVKPLTQLERDVLDWILRGNDPIRDILRQQVTTASVSARQLTGVGLYVDFVVPDDAPRLDESLGTKPDFTVGDVGARFDDANVEVGFVLFVRSGRIGMLEGYTYGNQAWPDHEGKYRLFYFGEPGTLSGGRGDTGTDTNGGSLRNE